MRVEGINKKNLLSQLVLSGSPAVSLNMCLLFLFHFCLKNPTELIVGIIKKWELKLSGVK